MVYFSLLLFFFLTDLYTIISLLFDLLLVFIFSSFLPSLMAYRISRVIFFKKKKATKVLRDSLKSPSNLGDHCSTRTQRCPNHPLRAPCRLQAEIQTLSRGVQGPLPTVSHLTAPTPAKRTATGNLDSCSDPVGPKEGISPCSAPTGAGMLFFLILGRAFHFPLFSDEKTEA